MLIALSMLILPTFADTHVVEEGDVLWRIAQEYDLTVEQILELNEIKDPNLIYVGQELNTVLEVGYGEDKMVASEGAVYSMASLSSPLTKTIPEGFRVTIIGSGLPVLDLNKFGPSVLVEYKDKMFLVDCGYQSVTGLMKAGVHPGQINNMFFTHQHADHNADYWTFLIGGWDSDYNRSQLTLAGPSVEKLHNITLDFYKQDLDYRINGVGSSPDGIRTNVDIHDFTEPLINFEVDDVKITAIQVPHTIETYAYKFEAGGQSVVITGDMTYNEVIAPFAKDADIMVIDALQAADFQDVPEAFRDTLRQNLSHSHLMNDDIATIVTNSSPQKLVLNHWTGNIPLQETIDLYRDAGYEGEVFKGLDGMVILP